MSDALIEPLYVISIEEVCWGGALVAITVAVHGFGMLAVLRVNHRLKRWSDSGTGMLSGLFPLILAGCMIMFVHLTEVLVWALFFVWKDAFPNTSVAYYFALDEYTTVGSKYNLPLNYRLLEGMIAAVGMLMFAWSTGVLFTLAQGFQNRQIESFTLRRRKKDHDPEA